MFYPTSVTSGPEGSVVYLANSDLAQQVGGGWRLSISLSANGRLIRIKRSGIKSQVLHDRSQKGGHRLSSLKVRRCRDVAYAVVAAAALGLQVSAMTPFEIEL